MASRYRLSGEITVEAALIFPMIIFIFIWLMEFSYHIRNTQITQIMSDYYDIKVSQVIDYKYSTQKKGIDLMQYINKSVVDVENLWESHQISEIYELIEEYNNENLSGSLKSGNGFGYSDKYEIKAKNKGGLKNASIIRLTHNMINHIEEVINR